jgi:hypothetical protein
MCRAATPAVGGKLFEAARYVDFFARSGGVKADPNAVVMAGLMAPVMPVASILAVPGSSPYQTCPGPVDGTTCAVTLQHSCTNAVNDQISGDPPVRIAQVLDAVGQHQRASICDSDYSNALQNLGNLIAAARGGGCIGGTLLYDGTQQPLCTVTVNGAPISRCGTGVPCWNVQAQSGCTYGQALSLQGLPAGAQVQASCAVKP